MLIGKIIAIAQRRRINFHGKRGEKRKAHFTVSYRVLPLPHHPPVPRLFKDSVCWKASWLKRSWASMVYRSVSFVLPSFTVPKASPPKLLQATSVKGRISAGCGVAASAWPCWWGPADSHTLGCRQCIRTGDGQQGFSQIWEYLWSHQVNLIWSLVSLVYLLARGYYGLGDVPIGSSGRGILPAIQIHHWHGRLHTWVHPSGAGRGHPPWGCVPVLPATFFSLRRIYFLFKGVPVGALYAERL